MLNTTVHLGFLFEPRLFTSDFYLSHDCSPRILIWASTVHHKKNVNLECSAQNFFIKSVCSTGLSVSPTIFFVVQKCAPPILGRHQNRLCCSAHTFFSCTGRHTVTTTPRNVKVDGKCMREVAVSLSICFVILEIACELMTISYRWRISFHWTFRDQIDEFLLNIGFACKQTWE